MNKNLTEIVFILDRSGSMSGLEGDTIGGYNALLKKQRQQEGEAVVTTVLFDDKYELLHECTDAQKVKDMTDKEYYARGCTALLDAIGKTISVVGNRHKSVPESMCPSKTIVVITTDGYENASHEFDVNRVKKMIEQQKEKYGWEFIFLGANIDAIATAGNFGIAADRAATYCADSEGIRRNFASVSEAVSCFRTNNSISNEWKGEIEDYMQRKMQRK